MALSLSERKSLSFELLEKTFITIRVVASGVFFYAVLVRFLSSFFSSSSSARSTCPLSYLLLHYIDHLVFSFFSYAYIQVHNECPMFCVFLLRYLLVCPTIARGMIITKQKPKWVFFFFLFRDEKKKFTNEIFFFPLSHYIWFSRIRVINCESSLFEFSCVRS